MFVHDDDGGGGGDDDGDENGNTTTTTTTTGKKSRVPCTVNRRQLQHLFLEEYKRNPAQPSVTLRFAVCFYLRITLFRLTLQNVAI